MTNTSLDAAVQNSDAACLKRSPDGLWWLDREGQDDHLGYSGHEATLAPVVKSLLQRGKSFVNVGAHVGSWALRVAHNVRIPVIAVEANPVTAGALAFNARMNHLENLVFVWSGAASDEAGQAYRMVDANDMASGGSSRTVAARGLYDKVGVTTPLDTILADLHTITPGCIMIDVEGAEVQVLRGAMDTLKNHRPNLLVEVHDHHPGTPKNLREDLGELLRQTNYDVSELKMYGDEIHWVCRPVELVEKENPWQ